MEFLRSNHLWFQKEEDGRLKEAIVCPWCKFPIVKEHITVPFSRIGSMYFHANCAVSSGVFKRVV